MKIIEILVALAVGLALLATLRSWYEVTHFKKKKYELFHRNIQKNRKIVFITDLHGCSYGKKNKRLIEAIKEEKPDYILSAGDMFKAKKGADAKVAVSFVEEIAKICPVILVKGNHETRAKQFPEIYGNVYQEYEDGLKKIKQNVIYLSNEKLQVDQDLTIYGLEMEHELYDRRGKETAMPDNYMEHKLGKLPLSAKENGYTILIAHNPLYFKQYRNWGANLVLSGHNHGNIVHVPFLGGLISPRLKLFDKYERGVYGDENRLMILSGGLGTHTIKVRLFNRPELSCITLNKADGGREKTHWN